MTNMTFRTVTCWLTVSAEFVWLALIAALCTRISSNRRAIADSIFVVAGSIVMTKTLPHTVFSPCVWWTGCEKRRTIGCSFRGVHSRNRRPSYSSFCFSLHKFLCQKWLITLKPSRSDKADVFCWQGRKKYRFSWNLFVAQPSFFSLQQLICEKVVGRNLQHCFEMSENDNHGTKDNILSNIDFNRHLCKEVVVETKIRSRYNGRFLSHCWP